MLKFALVTKPTNASPKVLTDCLARFLAVEGHDARIFYKISVFRRLLSYPVINKKHNLISWYVYKTINFFHDRWFMMKLKGFDAVIVIETSPRCFLKDQYDLIKVKKYLHDTPLIYHGVYYLGNAPTIIDLFKKEGHHTSELFDWHLSVSEVTEIRQKPSPPWSQIGMYLKSAGLAPEIKKGLYAVVDFEREGYEKTRNEQISVLEQLNIPYIALSKNYSIPEIREIYKKATFYFIQFGESFGLPIAECLSCGAYVFTPDSSWAMAWRLDENPTIHGPGTLPECFVEYHNREDLVAKLEEMKESYDMVSTPQKVFDIFYNTYPTYYDGNKVQLNDFINKIKLKEI